MQSAYENIKQQYDLQYQWQNTTGKFEMKFNILTVIDHLKVELFIAVYFNKVLHCYDETELQY